MDTSHTSQRPSAPPPGIDVGVAQLLGTLRCALWTTDRRLRVTATAGAGLSDIGSPSTLLDASSAARDAHAQALGGEPATWSWEQGGRSFEARVIPLRGGDGAIVGCVGLAYDVSDHVDARRRLSRAAHALANVRDCVVVTDAAGIVTYWNEGAARLLGWTAEEMVGRHYLDRYPPAAKEWRERQFGGRALDGEWSGEYEDWRRDGSRVWIASRVTVLRDDASHVAGYIGIAHDITERKRAEEELERSRALVDAIVSGTGDAIYLKDADLRYVFANDAAARFVGRTPNELVGRNDFEVFDSVSAARIDAHERAVMQGGVAVRAEERLCVAAGERTFSATLTPYREPGGRVAGVIGVSRDVTERARAEEALRVTTEKLRRVFEAELVGIVTWHEDGTVSDANDEYLRIIGYTREDLAGGLVDWRNLTPPELVHRDEACIRELARHGRAAPFEKEYIRKDGTRVPVMVGGCLFEGPVVGGAAFALDLSSLNAARSEAKKADALLRSELALTHAILEGLGDGLYGVDREGRVTFVNPAAEALLGWKADEIVGRVAHDLLHDGAGTRCRFADVWTGKGVVRGETTFTRKDGTTFTAMFTAAPMRAEEGIAGAVVSFRDVTEVRELEAQLRQSQKMEAFGRLAGGVAHDFNNLLTVINACTDELLESDAGEGELGSTLREIRGAGDRAARLTQQLLAFSRKQVLRRASVDVNALLVEMAKMLERLLGEHIEVVLRLGSAIPPVYADAGQLEQVVVNLAINARDAMPAGGTLALSTSTTTAGDADFVRIGVEDTGTGMDEATLARAFEPFFTTKPVGQGSGLGLATVYGIVEQSAGHVKVASTVGKGTVFEILLPAAAHERSAAAAEGESRQSPARRAETILLVEDESAVRRVTARILRGLGYAVLEAGGVAAAREIARTHDGRIELVVTDVIMPDGGGPRLVRELTAERPEMRVLFMSGYTGGELADQWLSHCDATPYGFIQKPFRREEMARKVLDALAHA